MNAAYDDRGFAALARQEALDDLFDRAINDLMEDADTIEKWFGDYDLQNHLQALELGAALADASKWPRAPKVALDYVADTQNGVYDFFGDYGCDTRTANELSAIISYDDTPRAYKSLRDYCESELRK